MTEEAVAYYERTAHCFTCGQPGDYCTCRRDCECDGRHPPGSAYREGALNAFTDQPPADHPELFGAGS